MLFGAIVDRARSFERSPTGSPGRRACQGRLRGGAFDPHRPRRRAVADRPVRRRMSSSRCRRCAKRCRRRGNAVEERIGDLGFGEAARASCRTSARERWQLVRLRQASPVDRRWYRRPARRDLRRNLSGDAAAFLSRRAAIKLVPPGTARDRRRSHASSPSSALALVAEGPGDRDDRGRAADRNWAVGVGDAVGAGAWPACRPARVHSLRRPDHRGCPGDPPGARGRPGNDAVGRAALSRGAAVRRLSADTARPAICRRPARRRAAVFADRVRNCCSARLA